MGKGEQNCKRKKAGLLAYNNAIQQGDSRKLNKTRNSSQKTNRGLKGKATMKITKVKFTSFNIFDTQSHAILYNIHDTDSVIC